MKFSPLFLSVLATSTVAAAAPTTGVALDPLCEDVIRTSVAALQSNGLDADEHGNIVFTKADLASVSITHVKVLSTACQGPAECDDQHPDTFTYGASVGKIDGELKGTIVATYHRGNCFVQKVDLKR